VLLLHILLFDKSYNLTYWLNYSELKSQLRRRYQTVSNQDVSYHLNSDNTLLGLRLATNSRNSDDLRYQLLGAESPKTQHSSLVSFTNAGITYATQCVNGFLASIPSTPITAAHNTVLLILRTAVSCTNSLYCGCINLVEYLAFALFYWNFFVIDSLLAGVYLPGRLVYLSAADLGMHSYS
jgi:hypothetical protein